MAVTNELQRGEIANELIEQEQLLASLMARLRDTEGVSITEIEVAHGAMTDRLYALNRAVADRIVISAQRQSMALSVRKVHEEFLEVITPVIDDVNFELMTTSKVGELRERR